MRWISSCAAHPVSKKINNFLYTTTMVKKLSAVFITLFVPLVTLAQWDPMRLEDTQLPRDSIYYIVENLMFWILGIFGFVGVIGFVISGIFYLTGAGDESQMEKAKGTMLYSILGVIVGLAGLVIIYAVDTWLTGFSSQF